MRILLIRHGETVHNVAGVYAGVTDSALTTHGVLQAHRLGSHLSATGVKITHLFSSDLQRAFKTAEVIRQSQLSPPSATTKSILLREQDFGFYEGKQYSERPKGGNNMGTEIHPNAHRNTLEFKDVETKESMRLRAESFISDHLVTLMHKLEDDATVAVVAHGIILGHLWRALLGWFHATNISVAPGIEGPANGMSLEYLGGWSNTGYLDLGIRPVASTVVTPIAPIESLLVGPSSSGLPSRPCFATTDIHRSSIPKAPSTVLVPLTAAASNSSRSSCLDMTLVVKAVNSLEHLKGLKKTRGGIGSLKHDSNQKTVDSFFKKRRLE